MLKKLFNTINVSSIALLVLLSFSSVGINAQCKKRGERHAACSSSQDVKFYDTNGKKNGKKLTNSNKKYTYELWQNKGITRNNKPLDNSKNSNARYGITNGYAVNAKWSKIYNALVRKSIRPGKTKTQISYTIDRKKMNGNVFYGGYGWWNGNSASKSKLKELKAKKNQPDIRSIVEFYVVENWGDYRPSDNGFNLGSYKVDGVTYDLYQINRRGPTVYGANDKNFTQVKAIRRTRNKGNSGTIKMGTHFSNWSRLGKFKPANLFEISFKLEGFYDPMYSGNSKSEFDGKFNATFKDGASFRNQSSRKELTEVVSAEEVVVVSPNPTKGPFTATASAGSTVKVYNVNGTLVAQGVVGEEVNTDAVLSTGMYLVIVTDTTGASSTQKLIIN